MKKALIIGITGQDGSYLSEQLLAKNYEVHGVIRRASTFNTKRIDHLYQDPHLKDVRLFLYHGDVTDSSSVHRVMARVQPDEIYNLAAQSQVRYSFDIPEYTCDTTAIGTLRILEAIRDTCPRARFYNAASSEMWGASPSMQNEITPFRPCSPYAIAKVFAFEMTRMYRDAYGLWAVSGILGNHESPRRGETFVTRKTTMAVARIKAGKQQKLYLGNLDARRDWGYAPEYMEAAWLMLQQDKPQDYAIGTGESHTVREFVARAFDEAQLDWQKYVDYDARYIRPLEVEHLCIDASKAQKELGWQPKVNFYDLVKLMVRSDMEANDDKQ